MDRDRLIKAWEIFRDSNPYEICDGREFRAIKEPEYCMGQMIEDTIALLKEQEEREQAICKEICDFIRCACSTDTDDDKDYVCYVIQNCFKHFCAYGERKDS